ncbi:hypothetical protein HRbin24_00999 [bacterium HR24]|nr:hypothetical protein HRbin24_00999 [bacterium HR24]
MLRALLTLALVGVLAGTTVAWALTITSSSRAVNLRDEEIVSDTASTVILQGIEKATTSEAAAGTTSPGVEADTTNPTVTNGTTEGNWVYKFQVTEAAASSWTAGTQYKVTVYSRLGSDWTTSATLYFQNASIPSPDAVEGVTVKVDLASSSTIPDGFSIHVEKVQ